MTRRIWLSLLFSFIWSGLLLFSSSYSYAQTETSKDKKTTKKENPDEWKEIFKLRDNFNKNIHGSRYVLGVFDGKFIGPNNTDNYGIRSFTTAYDYLILGNNFLSVLTNLGYTSEEIEFLSSKDFENHHPYKLGCIWHYSITQVKETIDSTYNMTIGKNVAVDKPFKSSIPKLSIDSSFVEADLSGFRKKTGSGKFSHFDTLEFPQIEGTGSWKDANNFDLAYEWLETFFLKTADSIDISKRSFSQKTPEDIKLCITERFNTKKYLEQNNLQENEIKSKIFDSYKNEIFDLLHQPNEKIFRFKNYEIFRFFNDVYWRDLDATETIHIISKNDNGEKEISAVTWKPGDKKNPIWHCAFQYDKDLECDSKTKLINFILLPYGTKGRTMPTVIPKNMAAFSQFEGVIKYISGCEKQSYSNKDDIWLNTINGRMINKGFYCYPYEVGILPLNDDGTVDGIYKIYVWKDSRIYWAYIYCGKHAAVQGGKPGKSFVDQVDNFRKNYNFSDYWYFKKELNYKKDIVNQSAQFIDKLEKLSKKVVGIDGKTLPKIKIIINDTNENNPKKIKTEIYYLLFNQDLSGIITPGDIKFLWRVEEYEDYYENKLVKRKTVILSIAGQNIALADMENYLKNLTMSPGEIRKSNEDFASKWKNSHIKEIDENYNATYNNRVYNLANSDETEKLIEVLKEELAAIRYEIPKAEASLETWQDENTGKMSSLKSKLNELETNKKTKTEIYKTTLEDYDKLKHDEDVRIFHLDKLTAKENQTLDFLMVCDERLGINLENDLNNINSRIGFLESEKQKYEQQKINLVKENKTDSDDYKKISESIKNKLEELNESLEKKKNILEAIEKHKMLESKY